jgi:hypothetical protein
VRRLSMFLMEKHEFSLAIASFAAENGMISKD